MSIKLSKTSKVLLTPNFQMVVYILHNQAPRTDLQNVCHILFSVKSPKHDMRDDLLMSSARQDSFEQVGNSAESFSLLQWTSFFLPVLLCQDMAVRCEQSVNKMKDHLPVISISVQRFQRTGVQILQQTVTRRYRLNSAKVKPSPAH